MKKRKMIGFLMLISLCMSSCLIVQAEDYVGPEYDENGFLMSPDELNADKPESTYYEDLEKELMEEESDNSTDEAPEIDNNVSTFYAYKKETPIHFSKFSTCGSLFSANLPLLLHILETIL